MDGGRAVGREALFLTIFIAIFIIVFIVTPLNIQRANDEMKEIPPTPSHILGTDDLGRDVLYLTEKASYESVKTSFKAGTLSLIVGVLLAYLSTYSQKVRMISNLLSSFVLTFPPIFISMLVLGISVEKISMRRQIFEILAVIMMWTLPYQNLFRRFSAIENSDYVKSAIALGRGRTNIFFSHFLPNSLEILLESFLSVVTAIISLEATLGFIGIGIPNSLGEQIRIQFLRSIGYMGILEFFESLLSPFIPIFVSKSYILARVVKWKGINMWAFLAPLGNLIAMIIMVKMIALYANKLVLRVYQR